MHRKTITISAITAIVLISIAAFALTRTTGIDRGGGRETLKERENDVEPNGRNPDTATADFSLNNLILPFEIKDIDEANGVINPIGVVRFSKDQSDIGHSGLDVPLLEGAPVYAVGKGQIVLIKEAGDPWGGRGIFHLLQPTTQGEGWAYIYEHVTPAEGLKQGDTIKKGDLIAHKTPPQGFTAHFQLSYLFNNYQFTRDITCWVDRLSSAEKSKLLSWWEQYRSSARFISAWKSNKEEGQFPFRGLLDTTKFADGPKLCYPLGTDVR